MKMQIDEDELAYINERLNELDAALDVDYADAREKIVDFLDGHFSPPLRPGWRQAWDCNRRERNWLGRTELHGDVYSANFSGDPLDDSQWDALHNVAVALVQIGDTDPGNDGQQQTWKEDAHRVIEVYLGRVTAPHIGGL